MNLPDEVAKIEKAGSADVATVKADESKAIAWIKNHAGIVLGSAAFIAVIVVVILVRKL